MKQIDAAVHSNQEVAPGLWLMWLHAPEIAASARPGQFLMVRCSDSALGGQPLLRRSLSIYRAGAPDGPSTGPSTSPGQASATRTGRPTHVAMLFSSQGPGTALLAHRRPGDTVDIIGPLGRGFSVRSQSTNLLLVAQGWGFSPVAALADEARKKGKNVTMLVGAVTQGQMYPISLLPPEAEVEVATEDGSAGRQGHVTDIVTDYWDWSDQVFAAGPLPMYRALAEVAYRRGWSRSVQALADVGMACGVGACYGCTIETRRGPRLACRDGPRFNLRDLVV